MTNRARDGRPQYGDHTTRRPKDVIHHSDQGCQYTSIAFGKRCRESGVRPSMGSVGDCYDNALCESFFATLECELIDRFTFRTKRDARVAVFRWIEAWYNPRRRHSSIGRMSPVNFERSNFFKPTSENDKLSTQTGVTPRSRCPAAPATDSPAADPGRRALRFSGYCP